MGGLMRGAWVVGLWVFAAPPRRQCGHPGPSHCACYPLPSPPPPLCCARAGEDLCVGVEAICYWICFPFLKRTGALTHAHARAHTHTHAHNAAHARAGRRSRARGGGASPWRNN